MPRLFSSIRGAWSGFLSGILDISRMKRRRCGSGGSTSRHLRRESQVTEATQSTSNTSNNSIADKRRNKENYPLFILLSKEDESYKEEADFDALAEYVLDDDNADPATLGLLFHFQANENVSEEKPLCELILYSNF